jgi:hypothetical protein
MQLVSVQEFFPISHPFMLKKGWFCSGTISIPQNSIGAWSLYQGNMQRICSNQHKEGIAENHGTDSAINDIFGT